MGDRSYIAVSENTTAKNALCLDGCAAGDYAPITTPSFNTCIITPVIKITSGATAGCVLTSSADGTASWQTPSGGGGVAVSGTTNDGILTYISATGDICAEPNLKWNGSALSFAAGGTRYIGMCVGSDTLCITGAPNNTAKAGDIKIEGGEGTVQDGGHVCIIGGNGDTVGSVYLYHGNTARLCTTTTGVNVTGDFCPTGMICRNGSGYLCLGGSSGTCIYAGTTLQMCATTTTVHLGYGGNSKLSTLTNGICVTGSGFATDWVASSDVRLKDNITPITSALSKIDALCGVCYDFCEDGTPDMGLIAQEVEMVEPRLVSITQPSDEQKEKYGIEELYSLKYDKFAGLFVEAIKELKQQNESLQNQINELNEKFSNK